MTDQDIEPRVDRTRKPREEREGHCPKCGKMPPFSIVCGNCGEIVNGVAFDG